MSCSSRSIRILSAVLCSVFVLLVHPVPADSRPSAKPAKETPAQTAELKKRMSSMESVYLNLQILSQTKSFDFDEVQKQLTQMEDALRKIRTVNQRPDLEKSFNELAGQVSHLNKWVSQQNPMRFRKQLDEVYQMCFRCHMTHAPKQP